MKGFEVYNEGDDIVAFNELLFKTFPLTLFDIDYLSSNDLLREFTSTKQQGRAAVQYFSYNNTELVLRHYCRGGFPAKFIQDKYSWMGLSKSRAIQELEMLLSMKELGLPVPTPAAARIRKKGLSYQADIVTVLIPSAKTLSAVLSSERITETDWETIGATIKKFHNHNCNHADLNAHNILLNESGEVYLIDFDKSKFNSSTNAWKIKNLERLKRSLEKLANEQEGFNYHAKNFLSLVKGYGI